MQKISTLWPHLAPYLNPFGQCGPYAHLVRKCACTDLHQNFCVSILLSHNHKFQISYRSELWLWRYFSDTSSAANYGPNWPDLVRIRTFCGKLVRKRSELVTKSLIWWLKTTRESSVYLKL